MPLKTLKKYKHSKEGYHNRDESFHWYLRTARITSYNHITKKANIRYMDGLGSGTLNVEVAYLDSDGVCFFGMPPMEGDIVLVSKSKQNKQSGLPRIIAKLSSGHETNRVNAFGFDDIENEYVFHYTRSPFNGDPYMKSSKGSEAHFTENLFLTNASLSSLEAIASQDLIYTSSRSYNIFCAGLWGNIGMAHRPMVYMNSDEEDIKSLHKNEYDREASSEIRTKIEPVSLEDGTFLYPITENDNEKTIDKKGKPYTEFDFLLSELHDPLPVSSGSYDLINEDFTKRADDEGKGHIVRFGFGTKIGRNTDNDKTYASPIRRRIFNEDSEDKLEFAEDSKDSDTRQQEEITDKKDVKKFGTSFWINFFQESKEVGFLEVLRSGAIKFFSNLKESDKDEKGNAFEFDIKGRNKFSIGEFSDEYEPDITECDDDDFPQIKKSQKDETVLGFIKKGINLFFENKDGNDNAFQLHTANEGDLKAFSDGKVHLHTNKGYRLFAKEDSVTHFKSNIKNRSVKNYLNQAKNNYTIQAMPINLALSPPSFKDDCESSGDSSEEGESVIQLGLGSDVDDNGEISGGSVLKVEPDNIENPTKLTISLGNLQEITLKDFEKIIFDGKVDVGTSNLKKVGVKDSETNFKGSGAHTPRHNHKLTNKLSSNLRAKGGSGGSGNAAQDDSQDLNKDAVQQETTQDNQEKATDTQNTSPIDNNLDTMLT